jgi:hypothetical protein
VVRIALIVSILGAAIALAACDQQTLLAKLASPAEQATAKAYIDQLRHHEFGEIEKAADPSIAGPSLEGTLDKMAAMMSPGPPISVNLIGAYRFASTAHGTVLKLTFEYHFPDRWALAILTTKTKDGKLTIVGFGVTPEKESLETQNRFKWAGKSTFQYAVLAYGFAAALFTLVVLVVAAKTKLRGRKWPWILFILFGVGKLTVNWTTGQWGIAPSYVQLFSLSADAAFPGPWMIAVSVPVGAIVFLLRRNTLRAADAVEA